MLIYRFYKILRMFHLISKKKYKKKTFHFQFMKTKEYQAIEKSKLFDKEWYLDHNPDVKKAGIDPIIHYLSIGWKEHRECTPYFYGNQYLKMYPDVLEAGMNPLVHWELYGKKEGRVYFDKEIKQSKLCEKKTIEKDFYKELGTIPNKIKLPICDVPLISIILVINNKYEEMKRCLYSILKSEEILPYEIILVEDNSNILSDKILENIDNARIIKNEVKKSVVENYNAAVKLAQGKYVYFIESNAIVQKKWLSQLFKIFSTCKNTGIVSSIILRPDGYILENGVQVFNNLIRKCAGGNPKEWRFSYCRQVDYISPSSMLMSKELFEKMNGFLPMLSSAGAAIDLCLSLQKVGYAVYVQPKSKVICSNQENAHLYRNEMVMLREKWQAFYTSRTSFAGTKDTSSIKRKPAILFIDDHFPQYDKHAGGKTIFQFIQMCLAKGFNVKFAATECCMEMPYFDDLTDMGVEIIQKELINGWIEQHYGLLDYIFVSRPMVAIKFMLKNIRYRGIKVLYYGHDLHHLRMLRETAFNKDITPENIARMRQLEKNIISLSDVALYPSTVEKEYLEKEYKFKNIEVITPYLYDFKNMPSHQDFVNSKDILFIGSAHRPNWDGIKWFINEVLPLVKHKIPNIKLNIVGSCLKDEIYELESENIKVLGFLKEDELEELYGQTKLSIAPLRFGAGIKGKVIDAFYHQVPVISTSVGAEGIPKADKILSIADTPEEFAKKIIQLYTNEKLWNVCRPLFKEYIADNFSYNSAEKTFNKIFTTNLRNNIEDNK